MDLKSGGWLGKIFPGRTWPKKKSTKFYGRAMISDKTMYGHVIYKGMKKSRFLKGLQNIFLNFFFCLFICFFSDTSE